MANLIRGIGSLVVVFGWMSTPVGRAEAGYIAYTFQGTGTGFLNTQSFRSVPVSMTFVGDTNNVQTFSLGAANDRLSSVEFSVQGMGTFLSSNPATFMFTNYTSFHNFDINSPENADNDTMINYPANSPLGSYMLKTAIGPSPVLDFSSFPGLSASLQGGMNIVIGSLRNATFSATTSPAVPEPASLVLTGIAGMTGLATVGARRARGERSSARA